MVGVVNFTRANVSYITPTHYNRKGALTKNY